MLLKFQSLSQREVELSLFKGASKQVSKIVIEFKIIENCTGVCNKAFVPNENHMIFGFDMNYQKCFEKPAYYFVVCSKLTGRRNFLGLQH